MPHMRSAFGRGDGHELTVFLAEPTGPTETGQVNDLLGMLLGIQWDINRI